MRYFILGGTVSSDATYKMSMFDATGQNVIVTNNDANAYRNVCQTKKFFTEPYDPNNNYFQYRDFNELDILKHLKATMPKQVIGIWPGSSYTGINNIYDSLRKIDDIIIGDKLLVYGGQTQKAYNQYTNRGYYIKGEILVTYMNPPIVSAYYVLTDLGTDYHYEEGITSSGSIYKLNETVSPDDGVPKRLVQKIGDSLYTDARTYIRDVEGYTDSRRGIVTFKISGGVTKIANDDNNNLHNGVISGDSTTVYNTYIRMTGLISFVPDRHQYCITSPNPFYNVFSKDGTLIKSEKMPVVKINNFDHIISPSYMSRTVNNNTAIFVGGYISKISHCCFQETNFPLGTNEGTSLIEHNSFLLNNDCIDGNVWISSTRKVNILPGKITVQDIKFTGEHVLVSGTTYYGSETVQVPFLDSQLSDIIYTCDNSDYTMKIAGRMPKPLLGSGLFPVLNDKTLVIGGIDACPNSIKDWKNVDGIKDVYSISFNKDVATVVKIADTKYAHMFPALYKIADDAVLIVSGNHYEIYQDGYGTIQYGDLKSGERYGSYIHKFVVNGAPQYCVCGGWKYTFIPYYESTSAFSDSFKALNERRLKYNGSVEPADDGYLFVNVDRDRVHGTYIPDDLDTDKDLSKAVYYEIDFKNSILVYNYLMYVELGVTLSYALCASNDKTTWYILDEKTDILLSKQSKYLFDFKNNTDYRYYRLYFYKIKKTIASSWPPPFMSVELGTDYFKCKVPVHYVGCDTSDNQIEKDGWWRPNLDFENFEPTQDSLSTYKYSTPSIEWNNKVETISDIFTNEYIPEFTTTKSVFSTGDDIVLKLDNLVTQYKSKICYTDIYGKQVEVDVNSTSFTLSSSLLMAGLNKVYLYIVKTNSLTYVQCVEFYVNTPISLTAYNKHPNVGDNLILNARFNYGKGIITPGNISVDPNSNVSIKVTSSNAVKYTLTVDLYGSIQTADITITPSIPVNDPVFTINGLILKSVVTPIAN